MSLVADLLFENAGELVFFERRPEENGRTKFEFRALAGGYCAISDGRVVASGSREEVLSKVKIEPSTIRVDCSGRLVTPGLVDPHTHPVFAVTREQEFEMRILGKSYEEIAAAGGGIRNSVRALRSMAKDELLERVRHRLFRFIELGTTTIEAKSGYGLSFEDEIKSLEILNLLNQELPLDIFPTFLGAHEVPDEFRANRSEYIQLLTRELIPYVSDHQLADFCDVFCEQGVYSIEEAREILLAAKEAGMQLRIHADQLHRTGATELAIELGALSADHLERLDEAGCQALAQSNTVAGLLPGAVFFLGSHHYPPGRRLLDLGASVALATDFNPGSSMTQSMPLMMTLSCLFMKFTPAEAWQAATIGAAAALGQQHKIGNLLPGYQADIVIWDAENHRQVPYYFGVNLVNSVFKKGRQIYKRSGYPSELLEGEMV